VNSHLTWSDSNVQAVLFGAFALDTVDGPLLGQAWVIVRPGDVRSSRRAEFSSVYELGVAE